MSDSGNLYICGTPIGNLEDISTRALKTLQSVDMIAAEDTRRTGQLLNYFTIKTKMISYHEHNERDKSAELIALLKAGSDIALVSDAGMPGISDPGLIIIKEAIREGIEVIPIPGPTAAISALVVSGLNTERFTFEGFLPRKGKAREVRLADIARESRTIIIYESPYRLLDTLQELSTILAGRQVVVVREISKIHEEKLYGTAEYLVDLLSRRKEVKGEIVLVIEGLPLEEIEDEGWEDLSIIEHLKLFMDNGFSKKEAIKEVARVRELPKREVYKEAVVLKVDKETKV